MKYVIENPIPTLTDNNRLLSEQSKQAMLLEDILSQLNTPSEVRDTMRELKPLLTHFQWGFGGSHMWVHRIMSTGEVDPNRYAILYFEFNNKMKETRFELKHLTSQTERVN